MKDEGKRCVYLCKDKLAGAHVVVDVKTGQSEMKKGHVETSRDRCERHTPP